MGPAASLVCPSLLSASIKCLCKETLDIRSDRLAEVQPSPYTTTQQAEARMPVPPAIMPLAEDQASNTAPSPEPANPNGHTSSSSSNMRTRITHSVVRPLDVHMSHNFTFRPGGIARDSTVPRTVNACMQGSLL